VVVQEYITDAVEIFAGLSYDEQLGPLLVVGAGGVTVEVYADVSRRVCPISLSDALEMIDEVIGSALLRGFRRRPPADIAALGRALVGLSELGIAGEGVLAEVDVNPLLVLQEGSGVKAADALVTFR
jgi:acetyltransferase